MYALMCVHTRMQVRMGRHLCVCARATCMRACVRVIS